MRFSQEKPMWMTFVSLFILASLATTHAYYLPGVYPREFKIEDAILVEANSMVSSLTELRYDYYSLPFCPAPTTASLLEFKPAVNLGTLLSGNKIVASPYIFHMMRIEYNKLACSAKWLEEADVTMMKELIDNESRVRLVLDNLPVTTYDLMEDPDSIRPGFQLGFVKDNEHYINNHLSFNVLVHEANGFYAQRKDEALMEAIVETSGRRLLQDADANLEAAAAAAINPADFVETLPDAVSQVSKLIMEEASMKKYMIVGFEVVACSRFHDHKEMVESVKKPCIPETTMDAMKIGTEGFLSPSSRGAFITSAILTFLLLNIAAGATATLLYGQINKSYTGWVSSIVKLIGYFPMILLLGLNVVNLALYHMGSSGSVPAVLFFVLTAIYLAVSGGLAFLGGLLSRHLPIVTYPVKTNQIPRHVPSCHWMYNRITMFFLAGILPFGTIYIELYFIMSSMWQGYFYYMFGICFLMMTLSAFITAEISILCTYLQLSVEDYHWWWDSYNRGGSIAAYVGLYSIWFYFTLGLQGFVANYVYIVYMSAVLWALYIGFGAIGFLSSYYFTYKLFSVIKHD